MGGWGVGQMMITTVEPKLRLDSGEQSSEGT